MPVAEDATEWPVYNVTVQNVSYRFHLFPKAICSRLAPATTDRAHLDSLPASWPLWNGYGLRCQLSQEGQHL